MPDRIAPVAGPEKGWLIHFLSDQQWCLHWSLYLSAAGEECVVCTEEAYGFDDNDEDGSPLDLVKEGAAYCASSFSEFLYRFWIENEIYFKLNDKVPLTAKQKAYAGHYR